MLTHFGGYAQSSRKSNFTGTRLRGAMRETIQTIEANLDLTFTLGVSFSLQHLVDSHDIN